MPISLLGFVGYVRTRQSRVSKQMELWLDTSPRHLNGKVVLPAYDAIEHAKATIGVLYRVPQAAPTDCPKPLPLEGFVGYLRQHPDSGELWIDPVIAYERSAGGFTMTRPPDCLGVFYALAERPLELRYPAEGAEKYEVQFPEE